MKNKLRTFFRFLLLIVLVMAFFLANHIYKIYKTSLLSLGNQTYDFDLSYSRQELLDLLGPEKRIAKDIYGEEWYVFYDDHMPTSFIQISFDKKDRINSLKSNSYSWKMNQQHLAGIYHDEGELAQLQKEAKKSGFNLQFLYNEDSRINTFFSLRKKNSFKGELVLGEENIDGFEKEVYNYINIARYNQGYPGLRRLEELDTFADFKNQHFLKTGLIENTEEEKEIFQDLRKENPSLGHTITYQTKEVLNSDQLINLLSRSMLKYEEDRLKSYSYFGLSLKYDENKNLYSTLVLSSEN